MSCGFGLRFIVLLLVLAGIEDHALGEKVVEETLQQANGFAIGFYVPYQEFMIKGRD